MFPRPALAARPLPVQESRRLELDGQVFGCVPAWGCLLALSSGLQVSMTLVPRASAVKITVCDCTGEGSEPHKPNLNPKECRHPNPNSYIPQPQGPVTRAPHTLYIKGWRCFGGISFLGATSCARNLDVLQDNLYFNIRDMVLAMSSLWKIYCS